MNAEQTRLQESQDRKVEWKKRRSYLSEVAKEIADRLTRIFLRDDILFYEYFHGDNGAGLSESHQTGWTGVVAKLIQLFGLLDAKKALETGKEAAFAR